MAFLEVITRTFNGRPELLARCTASLYALQDPDWVQTIILDTERRGVAWAVGNLATVDARGSWVWVLDDDDLCTDPGLIGRLKALAAREDPEVIAVKIKHGAFGVLPPPDKWRRAPALGWISTPNVIVRRDVWQEYRYGWEATYSGDYSFFKVLWEGARGNGARGNVPLRWAWLDRVVAEQPAAMRGATESEIATAQVATLRSQQASQ